MNEFTGKRLLILGGATPCCKVVNESKAMGVHTIVTDIVPNAPAKLLADETLPYSVTDYPHIIEWCHRHPVDGVINFCVGLAQMTQLKLSETFDFPCYGTPEQYDALTEKDIFKKLCHDNNVDTIRTYSEHDVFNETDFPLFVKPSDSSGSRGSTICRSKNELQQAIEMAKKESTNGKVIIETYMEDKQDVTISYLIKDGQPILISMGDRYHGLLSDNLEQQLACTIQPSRYTDMYIKNVNDRVIAMLKALGLKNSPVFMQGFVDGDTVRMYDPAIRFPGNDYELIYQQATGMSPMRSLISYVLGGEVDDYNGNMERSYDLNGLCAIQYIINLGAGKIGSIEGVDEIRRLPFVVDVKIRHFPGEVMKKTGDVRQRGGEVSMLVKRDVTAICNAINEVQRLLRIADENGNNMLVSAFDPQIAVERYATWHA